MSKQPQSQKELLKQLNDQFELLKILSDSFDSGNRVVAKLMATTLRVLLHDTNSSYSLLKQLNLKCRKFFDSSVDFEIGLHSQRVGSFCGLVGVSAGASETYIPYLDDSVGDIFGFADFDKYWNRVIFIDSKNTSYTRKDIVLAVANQDGGAHVDPEIDIKYRQLARENSLGYETSVDGKLWNKPDGAELAAVRQIVHEILRSFLPEYPNKKMVGTGNGIILGGMGVIFSKGADAVRNFLTKKKIKKVGRNEKCPCGSNLKFKRCHGR